MWRWTLIALVATGCGRVPQEPPHVVERVPSEKIARRDPTPDPLPAPDVPAVTPNPDTMPPRPSGRKFEPRPTPAPAPQPAGEPKPAAEKPLGLRVEGVEFPDAAFRSHRLIVFAAESEVASRAAGAYRDRNGTEIAELQAPKAGQSVWLNLIWGYYPNPTFMVGEIQARFDPKMGTVRIVLPDWTARPGYGIGMDWAFERDARDSWKYVGCRVQLKDLAPGEYSFEIAEKDPKALAGEKARVLTTGRFALVR